VSRLETTPEQHYEALLYGLIPRAAEAVVRADIARQVEQIRRAQVKLSNTHKVLKDIKNDNWPKDDNGFLTLSSDNPLAE
jgi:hypothetical protein